MRQRLLPGAILTFAVALCATASHADGGVATLTLDALSFISFDEAEVLPIAPGSTIRFHWEEAAPDGSFPITIDPADVTIAPIQLPNGQSLIYGLGGTARGTLTPGAGSNDGVIRFSAAVTARLSGQGPAATYSYPIPFTTETASATNRARTRSVQVTGMRVIDGAWHVQLVGAVTNKGDAYPRPGAAVYTVLSGTFDSLPVPYD